MTIPQQTLALQAFDPDSASVYTIDETAHMAHVSRHAIAVYCKHGLLSPVMDAECSGYYFNDEGIRTLRRIELFNRVYGINLLGIRMIFDLAHEVERLRNEIPSFGR